MRETIGDRRHGEIVTLAEISKHPVHMSGASVRVLGRYALSDTIHHSNRLVEYDFVQQTAVLEHYKSTLLIDTTLLAEFAHSIGRLYQFMGELDSHVRNTSSSSSHQMIVSFYALELCETLKEWISIYTIRHSRCAAKLLQHSLRIVFFCHSSSLHTVLIIHEYRVLFKISCTIAPLCSGNTPMPHRPKKQ